MTFSRYINVISRKVDFLSYSLHCTLYSIVKLTIVGCCDEEVSEEYEDEGVGEDVDEELEPQQVVQLLQHM